MKLMIIREVKKQLASLKETKRKIKILRKQNKILDEISDLKRVKKQIESRIYFCNLDYLALEELKSNS